ncbi:MAG: hypothetical protein WCH93_10625 [Actinomycetota bacterium]
MSQKQKPAADLGYAEALEELETILRELEEWFTAEGVNSIEDIRGVARRVD